MNSFTISQLQRFSGVNVHSIRAWEKRYDALKPDRSEGNTRYYNGNQLRRLLNIVSLLDAGHKISELCTLPDSKLYALLNENLEGRSVGGSDGLLVSQLVASALEFNEVLFKKVYSRSIAQHGMEGTYLKVVYPALVRLGVMWSVEKIAPAQEHFISNLIRQKLNASIDQLSVNAESKQHWLLFLPENEFHETGLLMANYVLRNAKQRSTYLGSNVPFDTLKETVKMLKPTSLLFFLVNNGGQEDDVLFITQVAKSFPAQKIFVAAQGQRLLNVKVPKNVTMLNSVDELKASVLAGSK